MFLIRLFIYRLEVFFEGFFLVWVYGVFLDDAIEGSEYYRFAVFFDYSVVYNLFVFLLI